jgi:hypothetical protein
MRKAARNKICGEMSNKGIWSLLYSSIASIKKSSFLLLIYIIWSSYSRNCTELCCIIYR